MRTARLAVVLVALWPGTPAASPDRQIKVAVTVPATVERSWQLWTTDEGVRSFFAPGSHIDLVVDGAYEVFFAPQAPPGKRGADGMRLLAVEPPRRLAFTWNAPPDLPNVRGQRTMVIVEFEPVGEDQTRVTLRHIGWGSGPEWEQALRYFGSAWSDVVLPRFRYRVQHGPIDWAAPPKLEPVAASMIESMVVAGP